MRKGQRKKPGNVQLPMGKVYAGGQSPDNNETDAGTGHLELNSTNQIEEGPTKQRVFNEESVEQGTAILDDRTITLGISRLTTDNDVTLIKVFQINATRSKIVMHQLDKLLESKAVDICLIQEPAIDGQGVYLLERHPYK